VSSIPVPPCAYRIRSLNRFIAKPFNYRSNLRQSSVFTLAFKFLKSFFNYAGIDGLLGQFSGLPGRVAGSLQQFVVPFVRQMALQLPQLTAVFPDARLPYHAPFPGYIFLRYRPPTSNSAWVI